VVFVPQVPVPIVPVATVNDVDGMVPDALTVIGVAVAVSQPACDVAVRRHSIAYTVSFAVKPLPVRATLCPLVRPVDGVAKTPGPVLKLIVAAAYNTPAVEPMAIAQVASVADVPHVPDPMVPVVTVKGSDMVPVALAVRSSGVVVSQPAALVAERRHSTTASDDWLGANPEPVIVTDSPLVSPMLGDTVIEGVTAAAAPGVPTKTMPPSANAAVATPNKSRFIAKPS
jgi:hypothetical protein